MSRLSTEATSSGPWAYTVWICLVSSSSATIEDLFLLAPICMSGRSLCSSVAVDILSATIYSRSLPIVLSSAIGWKALGLE
jgi:hypothetical protein